MLSTSQYQPKEQFSDFFQTTCNKLHHISSIFHFYRMCSSRKYPVFHTPPTEGIGISWGVGGSARPKYLKKCMKLNWNFQRGWRVLEKIPSVGEVWIFSGITQCSLQYTDLHTAYLTCHNLSFLAGNIHLADFNLDLI